MKRINNWEKQQASGTQREVLPIGGYVVKIIGAKEVVYQGDNGPFSRLEVGFDICEGEYTGFFNEDYKAQDGYNNQKWCGVIRLYVPTDDGSERDEWTKKKFKSFTNAVEDSNSGYAWDWDERTLKGKIVGILVRSEEWEYDGKTGWKNKPFAFIPADDVRQEKFKMPADKPLDTKTVNTSSNDNGFSVVDDDLPFM